MEEVKLCECGCGNPVLRATKTCLQRGYKKGDLLRFAPNHNGVNLPERIKERFWDKVDIRGEDECWEWNGYCNPDGYGQFAHNGKPDRAHRAAFILSGGILTEEKNCVCHTCDNPSCCNPAHLFAGSKSDNNLDMVQKRRNGSARGEKNKWHKITEKQVIEIRNLCRENILNKKQIAKIYGLDLSNIYKIYNGKAWAHIT
jgi:hypothetical protein